MGTEVEDAIAAVLARTARPQQPLALCSIGDAFLRNGDIASALACFDGALRLDVKCARAWVGRAVILHKQGRSEALGCLSRAIDADPACAPAHVLNGDILRKRGLHDEALTCYEQASNADPELSGPWLARATVLYGLKRMTDAARACERFLSLAPEDDPEILAARMMMVELERSGANLRSPESAPPIATPTAVAPVVEPPPRAKKKSDRIAETKSGPHTAANKSLRTEKKKSLGGMPAVGVKGGLTVDDVAVLEEVRELCRASRHIEALRKLEPIVKRCPESHESWVLRSGILDALQQYEPALKSAEQAVRLDRKDVESAKLIVRMLLALKKDERALDAADRVVTMAPRDPESHRMRGDCLVVLMRQPEAIFSYEKVILYAPDDAPAWLSLGRTLRQLRRFDEARMALTKTISLAESSLPAVVAQANEIMARLPP